jgi:hypothetical protein
MKNGCLNIFSQCQTKDVKTWKRRQRWKSFEFLLTTKRLMEHKAMKLKKRGDGGFHCISTYIDIYRKKHRREIRNILVLYFLFINYLCINTSIYLFII